MTSGYDVVAGTVLYPDLANTFHIRSLPVSQAVYSDAGTSNKRAETTFEYDDYTSTDGMHATLSSCSGIVGLDPAFTSNYTKRGNLTASNQWLDTTGGFITAWRQYDIAGNIVKIIDPRSTAGAPSSQNPSGDMAVTIEYSSTFYYAYPTKKETPVPDLANYYGTSSKLVSTTNYDFWTGNIIATTDPNQQTTTAQYSGNLDRLASVTNPDGGVVAYQYCDMVGNLFVRSQTKLNATTWTDDYTRFDGLGRAKRTAHYEGQSGGQNSWTVVDTEYDEMGRVRRTSNPYFATTWDSSSINPPGLWATSTYDDLSRVKTMIAPDGAITSSSYDKNKTTVIDAASKKRSSTVDALGRLITVIEDPGGTLHAETTYTYDTLGNLRKVNQGSQTRNFAYDSLSRLTHVKNPEQGANGEIIFTDTTVSPNHSSWSLAYSYDKSGNLTTRVDARNITTTYQYDRLNRHIRTEYTDDTPDITRHYDLATNGKGRLWYDVAYYADASTSYLRNVISEYDSVGRIKSRSQGYLVTPTVWRDYTTSMAYDLAGNLLSEIYPSGRTVTMSYGVSGRTTVLNSNGNPLIGSINYMAFGGISKQQLGNGLWEHHDYTNQLQMKRLSIGAHSDPLNADSNSHLRLDYTFDTGPTAGNMGGRDNNGNVLSQTITPVRAIAL